MAPVGWVGALSIRTNPSRSLASGDVRGSQEHSDSRIWCSLVFGKFALNYLTVRGWSRMSTASKATLILSAAVSTAIIAYVHLSQQWDLEKVRAGVDLDVQRQNYRRMVKAGENADTTLATDQAAK